MHERRQSLARTQKAKALVSKQEAVGTDFDAAVLNVLSGCSRQAVLQGILRKMVEACLRLQAPTTYFKLNS